LSQFEPMPSHKMASQQITSQPMASQQNNWWLYPPPTHKIQNGIKQVNISTGFNY
jgi:hypothetical protein